MFLGAASIVFGCGIAEAQNPKRTFYCGDGAGSLVVTVLNQSSIRVVVDFENSADGKFTMTMQQQGRGFHFVDGEYDVQINDSQDTLTYSAPDFGTIACVWSP